MENILVVDGYNIIFTWPELSAIAKCSLEEARDRLIAVMSDYAGVTSYQIVIVFDAQMTADKATWEKLPPNLQVVYSAQNETADDFIEKMIFNEEFTKDHKVFVATSDGAEQHMIFAKGAYRISARELREEVKKARLATKKFIDKKEKWRIHALLDEDVLSKLEKIRRDVT